MDDVDIAFVEIGTYAECGENTLQTSYFVPRYFKASWLMAKLTCESYKMKFASLETLEEFEAVHKMLVAHSQDLTEHYVFVNGMTLTPRSKNDWYWLSRGQRVNYEMEWGDGELNFHNNEEWCLCIGPKTSNRPKFADVDCNGDYKRSFICEKSEYQ